MDFHIFDGPLAQVPEEVAKQGGGDDKDAEEQHDVHHRVVVTVDFIEDEVQELIEVVHVEGEVRPFCDMGDLFRGVEQRVEDRDDHHEVERVEQRVE